MIDLRKDIAKAKEEHSRLSEHSAELEIRLSQAEGRSTEASARVERLEKDVQVREGQYRDLESHIAVLDTSKDNKLLVEELDRRNQQIAHLERVVEDGEATAERLRESLERLHAQHASFVEKQAQETAALTSDEVAMKEPKRSMSLSTRSDVSLPPTPDLTTDSEADSIDSTTDLRAALDAMTSRATAAEARVSELAAQLAEADDLVQMPSPMVDAEEASDEGTSLVTPLASPSKASVRRRESMPIGGSLGMKERGFRGGRGYGERRLRFVSSSCVLGLTTKATIAVAGAIVCAIVGLIATRVIGYPGVAQFYSDLVQRLADAPKHAGW